MGDLSPSYNISLGIKGSISRDPHPTPRICIVLVEAKRIGEEGGRRLGHGRSWRGICGVSEESRTGGTEISDESSEETRGRWDVEWEWGKEWRGLSLTVRRQDWEGKCDGLDIPWETPTQKMCDATGEARGLPEEFRRAVTQLPPVTEILRSTEARSSDLNETNLSRWSILYPVVFTRGRRSFIQDVKSRPCAGL